MNQNIKESFSGNAHDLEEPIWKSSALQTKIKEQLDDLIETMKKEIQTIQDLIEKTMDNFK